MSSGVLTRTLNSSTLSGSVSGTPTCVKWEKLNAAACAVRSGAVGGSAAVNRS